MTRKEEIIQAAIKESPRFAERRVGFITGAMWADSHPHWISVEDELPPKESEYEENSIVVLATDGIGVYKGLYRSGEYLSGWFTCDLWALENITHWMPLPQAPKKGGEQ